jgi:hypothetical protein
MLQLIRPPFYTVEKIAHDNWACAGTLPANRTTNTNSTADSTLQALPMSFATSRFGLGRGGHDNPYLPSHPDSQPSARHPQSRQAIGYRRVRA